jgi:hypothetical protein
MSAADRPSRIKQILEAGEYVSRDEIAWLIAEVERLLSPVERLTNEVLAHAIAADLASPLCQQCDDLGPYDRSPESCPYCAAIRVEAVLRDFPAGSGPQQDVERITEELAGGEGPAIPVSQYKEALRGSGCVEIPAVDGSDMLVYDISDTPGLFALIMELIKRLALRSGGPTPEGEPPTERGTDGR